MPLATLLVEFASKGLPDVRKDFRDLKTQLEDMSDKGEKVTSDMKQQFRGLGRQLEEQESQAKKVGAAWASVGNIAKAAFAGMTAALGGFITAGLQGSMEGERLATSMTILSQEIASVFLPLVEDATNAVMDLADWFRNLSGGQQDSILKWVEWGIGIGSVILILPKVISMIGTLITVFRSLGVAIAFVRALAGDFATVLAAGAVAAAATTGLYAATSGVSDQGKPKDDKHRRVTPKGSGITESISSTYTRIAASISGGGSGDRTRIAQDHLTVAQQQLEAQQRTNELLENQNPAAGR